MPRFVTARVKTPRVKDQRVENAQKQILVPELVSVHPIDADLWNMIIALPSLLYRYVGRSLSERGRCMQGECIVVDE